jgi:hypothetical protein
MFIFFLKSYRVGILDFCGSNVNVEFDLNGKDSKFCFRLFDDGQMNIYNLKSKHPNILRGVIVGKKSWGLWLNEWTDGIVETSFTINEIFNEFGKHNIEIPESLKTDFFNVLDKKWRKKYNNGEIMAI